MNDLRFIGNTPPEFMKDKKVLVRVDFNVPLNKKGKIMNHFRIEKAFTTLNYLKNAGAKIVIISHIGREKTDTLLPVYKFLKKKYDICFMEDIMCDECFEKFDELDGGEMILFENLRKWDGETNNDKDFVEHLAHFGDIFVNDAFSVSHREHASVTGLPKHLESFMGFQFKDEVENLSKVFDPEHPFTVLIGGAKFKTKIPVIKSIKDSADNIFVGGALANDIFRSKDMEVGNSVVSDFNKDELNEIFKNTNLLLPVDVITINKKSSNNTKNIEDVTSEDQIVDAGSKTAKLLKEHIDKSKMVVWNGPFGAYEQGYSYLTKEVVKNIAKSNAFSIAGGGDTVAEIYNMKVEDKFDFVSMAGGAMLEFIARGSLVGIEAMKK